MHVKTFQELRQKAQAARPKIIAVAEADDEIALSAVHAAMQLRIAKPVLIGNGERIRAKIEKSNLLELASAEMLPADSPEDAAQRAVALARKGEAEIILKGHLRTDQLLRAVLDRDAGLRTGRLLSDVLLYEDTLSGHTRLVGVTDGGINVAPAFEQLQQIIENAVQVMHALGFERPKIALMSATEAVTESVPSTVLAQRLTELAASARVGLLAQCEVYGPLALDNALLVSAARAKGITAPVAGHADVMVLPNIEAGNILGKAVKYLGGSQCAHVIMGARVPILIPSRVESADDKLNAIALGVLVHE